MTALIQAVILGDEKHLAFLVVSVVWQAILLFCQHT